MKLRVVAVGKDRSGLYAPGGGGVRVPALALRRRSSSSRCPRRGATPGRRARRTRRARRSSRGIGARERVVLLDERGAEETSESFARRVGRWLAGGQDVALVIGGADGLSDAVRARGDETLALSRLTLAHRLARLVLVEQLYRAMTILAGEPYHKAVSVAARRRPLPFLWRAARFPDITVPRNGEVPACRRRSPSSSSSSTAGASARSARRTPSRSPGPRTWTRSCASIPSTAIETSGLSRRAPRRADGELRGRPHEPRRRADRLPGPRAHQPRRRGRLVLLERRAPHGVPPREGDAAGRSTCMGLLSDGGVHSHLEHLHACLELARREGVVARVRPRLHGRARHAAAVRARLPGGRSRSGCRERGYGKVATVCGRYYAMDRDKRWDRVELAYAALVRGEGAPRAVAASRRWRRPTRAARPTSS